MSALLIYRKFRSLSIFFWFKLFFQNCFEWWEYRFIKLPLRSNANFELLAYYRQAVFCIIRKLIGLKKSLFKVKTPYILARRDLLPVCVK